MKLWNTSLLLGAAGLATPDGQIRHGIAVRLQLCSQLLDVPALLVEASRVLTRQLTRAGAFLFDLKDISSRILTLHDKFEAWYLEQKWPRHIDNTLSDSTEPLYPSLLYAFLGLSVKLGSHHDGKRLLPADRLPTRHTPRRVCYMPKCSSSSKIEDYGRSNIICEKVFESHG
jgi:hypothetical protein